MIWRAQLFEKRGIEVDVITGLSPEELKEKISRLRRFGSAFLDQGDT